MEVNTCEDDGTVRDHRPPVRPKPRRGYQRRRIEPYAWLAAGAVGIGIASALSAPAVAHAEETSSPSASATAPSQASTDTSDAKQTPRVFGQKVRGENGDNVRAGTTDTDSEAAQGDGNHTRRDSTSKRNRIRETSSREADSGTQVSTSRSRSQRTLERVAAAEESRVESKAEKTEKTLTAAATDSTPVPKKPAPKKLPELLAALFTRSKAAVVERTTAGVRGTSTTSLTSSARTSATQSTPLKNLLSVLFPRLRAASAPVGNTAPPAAAPSDSAGVPTKDDAGLTQPFERPDVPTGRTLNVRDYGATSNWSLDNDAQAIQRAIKAAVAGDTVYIPNGTYHIKSTINLKSGVSLTGESRNSTVLAGVFWTAPHAMIYAAPGTTNLTISSFRITSAFGPTYKAAIRLGMEGASSQVSRIAVQNVLIEKFERFGVQLQNAQQVLVEGNVIKNATALNGGGQGYGVIIDQAQSNNNWITRNEIGPVIRHAILVQFSANHNLIDYNTITGTVSGAIDLHGEDEYANEIAYNTISNGVRNGTTVSPNGAGIEIGEYSGVIGTTKAHDNSGPGNYVHHNTVYNYSMGLRVVNNSNYTFIEDNVFYNNTGAGIRADLAPMNNLYISGNKIYNNGSGILLYDVTEAVVENNTISDNRDYGLWVNAGTSPYLITGNLISGSKVNVTLLSTLGVYLPGLGILPAARSSV